mgnify:FL=1
MPDETSEQPARAGEGAPAPVRSERASRDFLPPVPPGNLPAPPPLTGPSDSSPPSLVPTGQLPELAPTPVAVEPSRLPPAGPLPTGITLDESLQKYLVTGDSVIAIRASIERTYGKDHDAFTAWKVNWSYPREAPRSCYTGPVSVTIKVVVDLPEFSPASSAPPGVIADWNRYIRALSLHEAGHRDFAIRAAKQVKRELERVQAATCPQLDTSANALGNAIVARHAADERAYDRDTSHGATQGARFPCRPLGSGCEP